MSKLDPLRQAVAVSPDNLPLLLLLAHACLDEWSLEEARSVFERILRLAPARPEAPLGIARILHLSGKTSEAFVRVEAVITQHPDFAPAHLLLARLHAGEGNLAAARSSYERALTLDPTGKDAALEQEIHSRTAPPAAQKPEPEKVTVTGWTPENDDESSAADSAEVERPRLTFADIGGMEPIKEEIRMKIIHPLKNPQLFKAYGKKIGGGVLLYGPPGCGKTLLSRATAGEIKASFLSIGIHQILDLYLGNSEKNLHQLFELARSHSPAVLFFDEVDALAADRNDLKRSAGRTLINQFLAEMDGASGSAAGSNDGLLILGATNAPWHLDPAFRRPGRFDRILFVPPPDEPARAAILEVMARDKPVHQLDVPAVARKTKDFSGADLKAVFDIAIERSLARAMSENRVIPLGTDDLLKSARDVKPSTRAWFESAKNYAIYSNQSGFYDDVLTFLGIKK